MLKYLGEIDSLWDLIDLVGESAAGKAWHGKLNYFKDLSDNKIFAVDDLGADLLFESGEVV